MPFHRLASAGVWSRFLTLAIGLAALSGCAAGRQGVKSQWVNAWVFGAFGGGDVDMRDLCASGRAREVSVGSTWSTLGVSMVTLGVYTPREVRVACVPLR